MEATEAAYVAYPVGDLLRLVALESCRQQCAVVGEDLGTVPEGFRERMRSANLLSCRVLTFERRSDGGFVQPAQYPVRAAASAFIPMPAQHGRTRRRVVASAVCCSKRSSRRGCLHPSGLVNFSPIAERRPIRP